MFLFLADHNFNDDVLRGWWLRNTAVDITLARAAGLQVAKDPDLLEWAANNGRIVMTHDRNTMTGFANDRIVQGLAMPGLMVVDDLAAIRQVIDDLELIVGASTPEDWINQVRFVPL